MKCKECRHIKKVHTWKLYKDGPFKYSDKGAGKFYKKVLSDCKLLKCKCVMWQE